MNLNMFKFITYFSISVCNFNFFSNLVIIQFQVKCLTLFVTHYPTVLELKNYFSENILTVHMAYILKELGKI